MYHFYCDYDWKLKKKKKWKRGVIYRTKEYTAGIMIGVIDGDTMTMTMRMMELKILEAAKFGPATNTWRPKFGNANSSLFEILFHFFAFAAKSAISSVDL